MRFDIWLILSNPSYKNDISRLFSSQWSLLVLRLSSSSQQEIGKWECGSHRATFWSNKEEVTFCTLGDQSNYFLSKDLYCPLWYLKITQEHFYSPLDSHFLCLNFNICREPLHNLNFHMYLILSNVEFAPVFPKGRQ